MKNSPKFVPYDDNNLDHVLAGPDYGQTGSYHEHRWSDEDNIHDIELYYSLLKKCRILKKRP